MTYPPQSPGLDPMGRPAAPSDPPPSGPGPKGSRGPVPLLLIGAGAGAGLMLVAVVVVTALISPGWLIGGPSPGEDRANSAAVALADGIESGNATTLKAVICSDADPYATAVTQDARGHHYLANVQGEPTVDGSTAEVKMSVDHRDGQTITYTVELAPRGANAWCVTSIDQH